MQSKLEAALVDFVREELGVSDYTDAASLFHDYDIESFQILEIVLELERCMGRQLSLSSIPATGLVSIKALVNSFDNQ